MDRTYSGRHEKFVTGHNGTTVWEVQLVTSVGPLALLLRNLAVPWLFPMRDFSSGSSINQICKLFLDYSITVVPIVLSVTLCSDRLLFLVAVLLLCIVILILFSLCEYLSLYRERPSWEAVGETVFNESYSKRPTFVSYFRAHMFIATIVGILAVDFPLFPRRFAKAETFGYGLMDVGAGVFVIINGIVVDSHRKLTRRQLLTSLKGTAPLILLGLFRLVALKATGYHEHVSEYGVHWNFFFTLAFVKILGTLLASCAVFPYAPAGLSLTFALGYEYALQYLGLKGVVMYGTGIADTRDNLFDANREGIVSMFGYLALHFFAMQLGRFLTKPRRRLADYGCLLVHLINFTFLSCILLLASDVFIDPPSRRIVNLTYVIWMIFLTFTQLTLFAALETAVLFGSAAKIPVFCPGSEMDEPFRLFEPCLWKCINGNALGSFLLANVMTGLVNLNFQTLDADRSQCLAVLFLYSFSVCAVFFMRYSRVSKREQRRKFE